MRWGMPTLLEKESLAKNVELCTRLGLTCLELNMNLPPFSPASLDPALLRRLTRETGIFFSLHLPEDMDLGHFYPSVRRGHREVLRQSIDWAAAAGVKLLSMHLAPGAYFTMPAGKTYLYHKYADVYIANLKESLLPLLHRAQALGITLCLENCGDFKRPQVQRALQALLPEGLYLTWDVGHDIAAGGSDRPFLMRHIQNLRHMHLHDVCAGRDHQVLLSGTAPIEAALQIARQKNLAVILEIKTAAGLEKSLQQLKDRYLWHEN